MCGPSDTCSFRKVGLDSVSKPQAGWSRSAATASIAPAAVLTSVMRSSPSGQIRAAGRSRPCAYLGIVAQHGETPDPEALTVEQRTVLEHWQSAESAAMQAVFGPHRHLDEGGYEIVLPA
jgi:hypothetical protein